MPIMFEHSRFMDDEKKKVSTGFTVKVVDTMLLLRKATSKYALLYSYCSIVQLFDTISINPTLPVCVGARDSYIVFYFHFKILFVIIEKVYSSYIPFDCL